MSNLPTERRTVNGSRLFQQALDEAYAAVLSALTARLNHLLAQAIVYLLGRGRYQRRQAVPAGLELAGHCARCHSHECRRFSRNGHRHRTLTTDWGTLSLRCQRLLCQCGGSLQLDLPGWLERYQRIGDDVDARIRRWGGLSLSLRQIQRELEHSYIGPLALRTLNQRLHGLQALSPEVDEQDIPPVIQVDGFFIRQLRPNGQVRRDRQGRLRAVKGRFQRCLLVALGIWPDSGRQEVLAFELAEREDTFAWQHFLTRLEALGLTRHNGLELIIHDGSGALRAMLDFLELGVAEQRCLFHKLKNISRDIVLPPDLPPAEQWRRRRAILKDFQAIWQAQHYATALRRYLAVYRQYRDAQPAAVATLRRDFRRTLTYYQLEQQHPAWRRSCLRTTSQLERFNRRLRRHCRSAGAYHSDAGILAMAAQTADQAFKPAR